MNTIEEEIFKNKKADIHKLIEYGFTEQSGAYRLSRVIADGQMELCVEVTPDGGISSSVVDCDTREPYTLFLMEEVQGNFVGSVRADYIAVLTDIADACFQSALLCGGDTEQAVAYILKTYGDRLEFLWENTPENAVWRRKDSGKWYGVLLTVSKRKLGMDSDGRVRILDLRVKTGDAERLIDRKKYFPAYHMNKTHWITVCLDGSLTIEELERMIDVSYALAVK